jgi:hypothetical protein
MRPGRPSSTRPARRPPPPPGEMRVAAPFGLGSCFDVGAVPRRAPTTRLSSFQGRCVARLREARRQTRCPPRPEV